MNEQNKGKILLAVVAVVIIAMVSVFVTDYKKQEEIVNKYNELYEEEGTQIVYFGKNGCAYCELYTPVIDKLMEDYDLEYNYIDSSKVSSSKLVSMLEKGGIDVDSFGTPTTLIIKDGEVINNSIGYMDRETTFTFLKENGVIASDAVLKPEFENITNINYSEYLNILKSSEAKVVVVGQTTCSHCITAKPYYDEIAKENNIDIYYLNYTNMSDDEKTAILTSTTYFKENEDWGTPLMLIAKDGDAVIADSGFLSKEATLSFLKENNIIK